ncbi:MAG TPA: UDP-N-acetylmuramoyl-L-alanyl-D-glutamate--2,6-diaminopimelate ligase [Gaiellaceae bacterium]|nr:UDP-N-acetylmuramoyl-L-alanyl-D-glutamate--2,6-diaminopimelate ligase [Gaiellaceae bacterium]
MVDSGPIDLELLATAVHAARTANPAPVDVTDLAYDARRVTSGALFVCVPGMKADGHDFAPQAVANGAAALIVEHELDQPVPQLVVADAREAMALAADAFFCHPTRELEVAGVTGTNGKTTTAFLLFAILAAAGRRPGLLGTIENRIGGERRAAVRTTSEAIDVQRLLREMLDAGDSSCAMEATSHGSALKRLLGIRFAVLVFTNLSQDHLDFHGTLEEYFDAKRRLFTEPDVDGRRPAAVVNVDDAHGRRLAEELRALGEGPVTFELGDAEDLELTAGGARFTVDGIQLETKLRGRFNVENVLGAVKAARVLGIEPEAIATGVEHVTGVPGRFEAVDEGQPFTVLVDYAHTPEALENVLSEAREITAGRLVCVFGCGGDRDRGKRPLMGEVVARLSDSAIVTSDNPRSEDPAAIIEEIVAGMPGDPETEADREKAIALALERAGEGDVVVIAGKGHEQGQEFADRIVPFDDREVAREALRRLAAKL